MGSHTIYELHSLVLWKTDNTMPATPKHVNHKLNSDTHIAFCVHFENAHNHKQQDCAQQDKRVWKVRRKTTRHLKYLIFIIDLKQLIGCDVSAILHILIILCYLWIIYSFILRLPCLFINNLPILPVSYLCHVALHFFRFNYTAHWQLVTG